MTTINEAIKQAIIDYKNGITGNAKTNSDFCNEEDYFCVDISFDGESYKAEVDFAENIYLTKFTDDEETIEKLRNLDEVEIDKISSIFIAENLIKDKN